MIALDTNVVVRVVVNDEPTQGRQALEILRSGPTWLSKTVLLEIEWVLRFSYEMAPDAIAAVFDRLLDVRGMIVEDQGEVELALAWYRQGLDFADALHVASSGAAARFATFDKRLARRAARTRTHPPVDLAGSARTGR